MQSEKAILVLDVDGCFNPCPFDASKCSDWKFEPTFRSSKASGRFSLNLSKEMGKAIDDLDLDIRWLTTWGLHAHLNIAWHFGWPSFPVLAEPPEDTSSFGMYGSSDAYDSFWKVSAMRRLLNTDGPKVIWIDDDMEWFYSSAPNMNSLDPFSRLLKICPWGDVGITKEHIEKIKDFIK